MKSLMMLEGVTPYEGSRVTPKQWNEIPFNAKSGGCGASMRYTEPSIFQRSQKIELEQCVLD